MMDQRQDMRADEGKRRSGWIAEGKTEVSSGQAFFSPTWEYAKSVIEQRGHTFQDYRFTDCSISSHPLAFEKQDQTPNP